MGVLDNVERGLEKAVRGAFTRGSKSQVQPVEIASRIRREMDDQAMTFAEGRTLAPNVMDVRLSEADFQRARTWGTALAEELCDVVIRHARSQSYSLQGPVRVSFTQNLELKPGDFEVISSTESASGSTPAASAAQAAPPRAPRQPPAAPQQPPSRPAAPRPAAPAATALKPVLDIGGRRYSLNADSIVLGRSSEADILIDDTGASRRHLELRIAPDGTAAAVDLGSTNGSFLDGRRINGSAELSDGSILTVGRSRMIFRLIGQGQGTPDQPGRSL